jgi:hypothetical protein
MPEILLLLLFNSLYSIGFYLAMEPGMIGGKLGSWLSHHLGKAYEPIAGCITCMASLHSWPYLVAFGFDWVYIIYVFALAGLNTSLYNKFIHD